MLQHVSTMTQSFYETTDLVLRQPLDTLTTRVERCLYGL